MTKSEIIEALKILVDLLDKNDSRMDGINKAEIICKINELVMTL